MPDEYQSWERVQQSAGSRGPFTPRVSTVKVAGHGPRENPYRKEAERDRIIFRWVMGGVIVVGLMLAIVLWSVLMAD